MNTKRETKGMMSFSTREAAKKYVRQYLNFENYKSMKVRGDNLFGIYIINKKSWYTDWQSWNNKNYYENA